MRHTPRTLPSLRSALLTGLLMNLMLGAPSYAATTTLVEIDATWRFLDDGSDQGTAWRQAGFDDSGWSTGPAELGYGDSDEATVVSFGPDDANKFATTYLRHSFQAAGVGGLTTLRLRLRRDDGAIVYLNGSEVVRSNMPSGTVNANTLAASTISGAEESALLDTALEPDLLLEGANLLAVEIHQRSGTSSDISFALELLGGDGDPFITRGPYLQRGASDSVVVRWRTDQPTDSQVRFGTQLANLDGAASNPAQTTQHVVPLTGLSADTQYFYEVGTTTTGLAGGDAEHRFLTAPSTGTAKPSRIWVLGDSGTANTAARAVRDGFAAFTGNRDPDVWLMLGDNAYEDGTDTEYQAAVFDTYPQRVRQTVLWPTMGNHDIRSADSPTESGVYYDIFTLPRAAEAGGVASGTEAYYSFDYGNIHFICLDSQDTNRASGGAMLTWLEDDLIATTAQWIIAFWHHPPYSKGSHDSDTESRLVDMRENALPILETHGVDLVLGGHSHSYERSFLIDGHYGTSGSFAASHLIDGGDGRPGGNGAYEKESQASHAGSVYIVAGNSGRGLGSVSRHPAIFSFGSFFGSVVIDVEGNTLEAFMVETNGSVFDSFVIDKSGGAGNTAPSVTITAPANPTTVTEGTSVTFTGTANDVQDGSLTGSIAWSSNLDGALATGGSISATLSVGTHAVTASVTDSGGLSASDGVSVTVTPDGGCTPGGIDTDFESGLAGWSGTGLWHLVANSSCVPPGFSSPVRSVYYGQDAGCNYDAGDNNGTLISPTITGILATSELRFDFFRQVESFAGGSFDQTLVEVKATTSTTWTAVFSRDSTDASAAAWGPSGAISLAAFSGQDIQVRFRFDSIDGTFNAFAGWAVDNVVVTGETCNDPPPPGCTTLHDSGFEAGIGAWSDAGRESTCTTGDFVVGTPTVINAGGVTTQVGGAASGTGALFTQPNQSAGNADVDGGVCVTRSPVIDASGFANAEISFDFFHGQRDTGDDAGDFFVIELSTDGGASFTSTLVSLGDVQNNAVWTPFVATVNNPGQLQLRLRVADGAGPGDLVEAGIDDVLICGNN